MIQPTTDCLADSCPCTFHPTQTSPLASCSDTSPPFAPTVTSPKTYLRTLQERLGREASLSPKKHTYHRNRAAIKKQLLFEPAFMKKANSETESSGVSSTHSLLSSATDSDLELRLPTTTTTTTQHSGKPSASSWHTPSSRQPSYGGHIDALTASLQEINGKLWQVLDRLNDQTEFSHHQQLARQGVPPLAAPGPIYPPTGFSQLVADRPKLPLHSSDRYAEWTSCHDCALSVLSSHTILPGTIVCMPVCWGLPNPFKCTLLQQHSCTLCDTSVVVLYSGSLTEGCMPQPPLV